MAANLLSADRGGVDLFLSPPEIKQQQLREKRGTYERQDVDALLDNVVGSYQHVWLERDKLAARVEELEREIANTKELEKLLREGLASAQRAAEQVREEAQQEVSGLVENAKTEADTLLANARREAEEIVSDARETHDRLREETERLEQANSDVRERYRAFLLDALRVVEASAEREEPTPVARHEAAPVAEPEIIAEPEQKEQGDWLATVPLMAVTTDEVADTVAEEAVPDAQAEPEPEAEPEPVLAEPAAEAEPEPDAVSQFAPEPEAAVEPEPEPEPEPVTPTADDEEDVPATVLLSAITPVEETTHDETEPQAEHEPEAVEAPEPEPLAEIPEPEPEPIAEAAPAPEPEPEPAEETAPEPSLAPEEAYMTYKGISVVPPPEPRPAEAAEPEADEGEDTYEDWSPRKG